MQRLVDIFDRVANPILITDADGRVILLNRAACVLLQESPQQAHGARCWQVARLLHPNGSPLCSADCPVQQEIRDGSLPHRRTVIRHLPRQAPLTLEVFTIALPFGSNDRSACLHLVAQHGEQDFAVPRGSFSLPRNPDALETRTRIRSLLTAREVEILDLLAKGLSTRAIAKRLSITPATVRTHVEHLLGKLRVHRRVEAVVLWLSVRDT